jgi:hypothetical protein
MFNKFISNFLTIDECNFLISLGESIGLEQMKSSKLINGKIIEAGVDYSGNKRMGCYFVNDVLHNSDVSIISDKILSLSNKLNPYKGVTYTNIKKYSFNRYSTNDFLDWHEDKHEIISGATITFIIQLNTDYIGGDVKYIINGKTHYVPKEQGSVFIFDSNITHSVDTIQSGLRYSINVWPSKQLKKELL